MSKFGGPLEDDHEDDHKPISPNHAHPPRELAQAPGGEEESSPDPGSKGRSMKIKIKMPPPPPPPPRPLPEPDNLEERSSGRYCCGKFFPSGKAWGGHKRHHGLKELKSDSIINSSCRFKKPKLQPPCPKNTFNVSNEDEGTCNGGGTPVCCLCGKNFPSMNALFGHMRFHRDRGWKGIKPPTKHASSSSSPNPSSPSLDVRIKNPTGSTACLPSTSGSSSGDAARTRDDDRGGSLEGIAGVADLMGSLPLGWTTKNSRGRLASCPDVVAQAALSLMRISRDEGGGEDVNNNGGVDEASSFPCGDHQRGHNRVFEFDLNKPPQEE